jgi:RNA 3'-terminal phosphate cyclase (ATP)
MSANRIIVDGAQGEGGGQILRSSLALAALTGRPLRIERIRAGRPKPGLSAQHLASVRAAAEICNADVSGAALRATELDFLPRRPVRAGRYDFNVADARKGGSAGAAALVLQTVLLPLALAKGDSALTLLGGTHVPWSPSFDYLERVFLPAVSGLGLKASLELRHPGFYPVGGGRFVAHIEESRLTPLKLERPGQLLRVSGLLTIAGLDSAIAERMEETVVRLLEPLAVEVVIARREAEAKSPGVALVLTPEYERGQAGFSAVGERGKRAEAVAAEACEALLAHHQSHAAVDIRLADQLLLPLAFAAGPSSFTTARATNHLKTNAAVIEQFGLATITISASGQQTLVRVQPQR